MPPLVGWSPMLVALAPPAWTGERLDFRMRARDKRSFHTVLDAADVFPDEGVMKARVETDVEGRVTLVNDVEMRRGRAEERVVHSRAMELVRLERRVFAIDGTPSREE